MMNYRQISIIDLLRIFSELYSVNIVISKDINEEDLITVRLQNVPLHGALEAILTANEYNYVKKNNIILIKNRATEIYGDLQTEIFQLDYINAGDIIENLRNIISPRGNIEMFVNSPMGEVGVTLPTVSGGNQGGFTQGGAGGAAEKLGIISEQKDRSDVLIVTDYPEVIDKLKNIIERLDNPPQQVRIEVKLIETKLDDTDKWGINWTATVEAIGRGGTPSGARQQGGGATGGATGGVGEEAETEASTGTQVAGKPITVNNFRFGTLSFGQFRGLLEMLEQRGNSRLLNQPSISVIDNQQADIAVGTLVPVEVYQPLLTGGGGGGGQQQQSAAGGTTIQQQFVSIALTVIPHVSIDKYVTLWIQPSVSEITGYTGKYGDLPVTSTRTANSQVRVRDGDTVIIGGLIKEDKLHTTKRVKFLHKIPLFGSLFVYNAIESSRSELAVFITPYIIRSENFVAGETINLNEK
ncbi:secretin N-terminal domain-containing protein [candidate division KSB1 bacterium]